MIASKISLLTRRLAGFGFGLGIVSIVAQYITFQPLFRQMGMGPISSAFGMLMFFTILTNLATIVVYWSAFTGSRGKIAAFFSHMGVRTAVAAQITLVAIVYVTIIRGQLPLTRQMMVADALLHYVTPVTYLVWWWLLPGKQSLRYANIPRWLVWPVTYLFFIMMEGFRSGAFIYPFLDVNKLGVTITVINIALLIGLLAVISAGLILAARLRAASTNPPVS